MEQKNSDAYQADACAPALFEKVNQPTEATWAQKFLDDAIDQQVEAAALIHESLTDGFTRLGFEDAARLRSEFKLMRAALVRCEKWLCLSSVAIPVGGGFSHLEAATLNADLVFLRNVLRNGSVGQVNFSNEAESDPVSLKSDTSLKDSEA